MADVSPERVAYWRERFERAWAEREYPHGARMTVTPEEAEELRAHARPDERSVLDIGRIGQYWAGVQILVEEP